MSGKKPLVLMILDGWGCRLENEFNAIRAAHTPQWDEWMLSCPYRELDASGAGVGLPGGQMGNSEVGHMHIGAGRVIYQDFTRINQAIERGDFEKNPVLTELVASMKSGTGTLHVMGLLSEGGVHSHQQHLLSFLSLCHALAFDKICLHLFLDGRDTPPQSALNALRTLNRHLKKHPVAVIASICGRYYAMDRDKRWERVEKTYNLLTSRENCPEFPDAETAVAAYYQDSVSDEFIPPARIGKTCLIEDGDSVFFFNFRADRARQLTEAFLLPEFSGFQRQHHPALNHFISMTFYGQHLPATPVFPPVTISGTLGEIIASKGLKQLRIAETEKYAHVTFFFNGGSEQIFEREDRILIPSPRVATYDLMPEMSAPELTCALVQAIEHQSYDVIICNYANADMVGHSGNFSATVAAIECLDGCLAQVQKALQKTGGSMLITADHGNAEAMYDNSTGQPHTAHTSEPVPLLYTGKGWQCRDGYGTLADIAPTVLTLLGIEIPSEMTGTSLLVKNNA